MPTHQRTRLDNGLDILAEDQPNAHSVAVGLFVKTGTRDEPAELVGVSHFLEHMMFKGSQKYGWEDVNRIFDEMGARYNAFTSQEMTAYYANVLPEFTERAVEHLSELLRPAIRESDFDTEKNVILEEIAMYADDPGHRLYEQVMQAHFEEHPLSLPILGTPASIKAMRRDDMAAYFKAHYGPGNMVLAVTGQFDFEQIVELAKKYMGDWPAVNAARRHPQRTFVAKTQRLSDPKLKRTYTMALTPGPSAQDEDRFAARVLADVVGDSDGSRFYWSLVETAIAEDADFGFYPHDGIGSFYISLLTDPKRTRQALDLARAEVLKVRQDLTDDEVERAKNKLTSGLVLGGESPMSRMRALGSGFLYNGEYRSVDDDLRTVEAITPKTVRDLLEKYSFDPMTICMLGPEDVGQMQTPTD
ncbi:MAG: M16 family metallopeptidase [Phycisphaerae bacterium]